MNWNKICIGQNFGLREETFATLIDSLERDVRTTSEETTDKWDQNRATNDYLGAEATEVFLA
jgi:hypothetical protein